MEVNADTQMLYFLKIKILPHSGFHSSSPCVSDSAHEVCFSCDVLASIWLVTVWLIVGKGWLDPMIPLNRRYLASLASLLANFWLVSDGIACGSNL